MLLEGVQTIISSQDIWLGKDRDFSGITFVVNESASFSLWLHARAKFTNENPVSWLPARL